MATSQNGWPVKFDKSGLRLWQVPDTDRRLWLRDGSAGFLLVHLALWFHETIEPLDAGVFDDWGWAVRPVRGQLQGYSNHGSGTAADLNATRHPRGVFLQRNLSVVQIIKIRARLRMYRGAIRWGGDYTKASNVDGMHFELNKSLASAEEVARHLMTSPRGKRILAANPGSGDVILS